MKVNYENITFDSELEVEFYKYLELQTLENCGISFLYQESYKHTPIHINLGRRKNYTPDFIVIDDNKQEIHIIETKGYAKWSANEDNNIMDFMKNKVEYDVSFLRSWLEEVFDFSFIVETEKANNYDIKYHRIKHLKGIGFVDYNYKNPNSISNKRKLKIEEQNSEIKELKLFKKNALRYFGYLKKIRTGNKITKVQNEWARNYELSIFELLEEE